MGARFLQDGFVVTGRYTTFSNNKKMVIILHRELEHKVEKVLHMKLDVMRPKTKNNMNYQPEYTITDQSTLSLCEEQGWRGGGAYLRGGLNRGFNQKQFVCVIKWCRVKLGTYVTRVLAFRRGKLYVLGFGQNAREIIFLFLEHII